MEDLISKAAALYAAARDGRLEKPPPIEVGTDWFDNPAPGTLSKRQGYVTKIETEDYLLRHIKAYILDKQDDRYGNRIYLRGWPIITLHECWSGYSEYTVTRTWTEMEIVWGGYRAYFGNTTAFFRAMAIVDPEWAGS